MAQSYSLKSIRVTITLADAGRQMVFTDPLAIAVNVQKTGAPELPKAKVAIKGLTLATMSQLTMLSFDATSLRRNFIEIAAGEKGRQLAVIFRGEITTAQADMNASPSPVFQIDAITCAYPKLIPQTPVAVSGNQPASDMMETLAKQAGLKFVNDGVTASISNCVINGDAISKMKWVADTVGADLVIDDDEAHLIPRNGTRNSGAAVTASEFQTTAKIIGPDSGAIGYPSFDAQGIRFCCFFRPDIQIAGYVRISSSVARANGTWKVYSISHTLSANDPGGGPWRTEVAGTWMGSE